MTRIAAIKQRAEKASGKPWVAGLDLPFTANNNPDKRLVWTGSRIIADFTTIWVSKEQQQADAEFAAHSRADIDWLLEQNEKMLEALKKAEPLVIGWAGHHAMAGCTTSEEYALAANISNWHPIHRSIYEQVKAAIEAMESE